MLWIRRSTVAAVAAVLAGTSVVLAARLTGWQAGPLLFLVTGTPYLAAVCALAALAALLVRSWGLASVAGIGFLSVAVLWAPPFVGTRGNAGPTELTVMTLNLQFGRADAESVVAAVRDSGARLLAVQELTPTAQAGFERAGRCCGPAGGRPAFLGPWPGRFGRAGDHGSVGSTAATVDCRG